MRAWVASLAIVVGLAGFGAPAAATPAWFPPTLDPENTLVMLTQNGTVLIGLRPDLAPNHVARVKQLTRNWFYDGTPFHRVIDGFVVQGGDPTGTGEGGTGKKLKAEFSPPSKASHVRGTLAMARDTGNDTADSQFYITLADVPRLDGKYTIFGTVIAGMDVVDQIKKAPKGLKSGKVTDPDWLIAMRVAADLND
ncbi:peptidylprolyl isomerase [Roseiterribacter gracilis]|uniref:Peptidyl-prolyl cis-trans isomerase n=1 Tax=Roseiterribacter gracilis TaxID=2812848 RepID=A0A8S8XIN5_9PROT|nr:peptidyl-prolyl cis-trans isomerase [Rhodospirillales bacterium TMPK1]